MRRAAALGAPDVTASTLGDFASTLGDFATPQACTNDPNSEACVDALAANAAAAALSEFGPVGTVVGYYIGGHAREWGKGAWNAATGWLPGSGASPCECQLGSCNSSSDDDFNLEKYNVLKSQCKSPTALAAIETAVLAQVAPLRAQQTPLTKSAIDRFEICMKLTAFAECAAKDWRDDVVVACADFRHWVDTKNGCVCDDGYKPDPLVEAAGGGSSPCVPDAQTVETSQLVACLGTCGDGPAGVACAQACKDAHPLGDLGQTAGPGSGSGGSGVGTVVALGAGALALYAGVQMFRGKPLWLAVVGPSLRAPRRSSPTPSRAPAPSRGPS